MSKSPLIFCGSGGTGRRAGLKNLYPQGCEGSTPSSRISMEKKSSIVPIDLGVLAYVVGLAIGDGNLSNPNGRAIRLRITCHVRYQSLIQSISQTIQALLPKNKVSIIKRSKNYLDISCYSNQWKNWLDHALQTWF